MPVCPQCGNRPFTNKEALLQHMKTSSAWHPFCSACDRRFSSQDAYTAHMNDKHPPTFDCTSCNRQFQAPYALEDHYRGSQLHPNCVRCGRGFKDAAACEEHHHTAHPKAPCVPCGGILLYEDALDQHHKDSGNHPTCKDCEKGFKDSSAYNEHFETSHPERYCETCKTHFATPETLQSHVSTSHPDSLCGQDSSIAPPPVEPSEPTEPSHPTGREIDLLLEPKEAPPVTSTPPQETTAMPDVNIYSTGFTPLSAIAGDPMRALVVGERRNHSGSPDLRLELALGYSSPLTEVKPLFSPSAPSPLPRPGESIDRFWTSRENITTSRLPLTPNLKLQHELPPSVEYIPQTYRNFEYLPQTVRNTSIEHLPQTIRNTELVIPQTFRNGEHLAQTFRNTDYPPQPYRNATDPGPPSPTSSWLEPVVRPQEGRRISPPRISPPFVSLTPQFLNARSELMTDFNSRLYPGSVRQAMRASANALLGRRAGTGSSVTGSSSSSEFSFQFNQGLGAPLDDLTKIKGPGSQRSFDSGSQSTSSLGRRGRSLDWQEASLFSEMLVQTPTPTLEVPNAPSQSHSYDYLGIHSTSPSLATFSSPASSTSVHHEPDTRPTTASSTPPALRAITYTITPSSECPSPRSPEVTSPVGLGILPTISPLASTPIDLYDFDFPEAKKPLPESPVTQSPVTVVLDLPIERPVILDNESPLEDLESEFVSDAATFPIPLSTTTTTTPTDFTAAPSPTVETAVAFESIPSPIPQTPIPLSATRSNRSTATSTSGTTALHPNPLHCRVCLADTCDDITASMCGHIFCNRCITDAVIKTNRCPVCMTPTLLYCLFRLDLAA